MFILNTAEASKKQIVGQNEGLRTKEWRAINAFKEGCGIVATFTVDQKSVEVLERSNSMVDFYFGEVQI